MGEREPFLDADVGQPLQPVPSGGADPVGGPVHRQACVLVEHARVQVSQHRRVMVAANRHRALASEPGDDVVGIRAVAHDVAQDPHRVKGRAGLQDGFEGRQIGVDIRQDRDPHAASA